MTQLNTPQPGAPGQNEATNKANFSLILIAVALGIVAVLLHTWYVARIRAEQRQGQITIFRLNNAIEPGDELERDDLTPVQIYARDRAHYVEALKTITAAELDEQLGQAFKRPAASGEYLSYHLFVPYAEGGAVQPAKGKRAVPISVARESAPSSLQVGQLVDISAMLQPQGGRLQSTLILERVNVLAVGDKTQPDPTGRPRRYNTITIEIDPDIKEALKTIEAYAEQNEFIVAIRRHDDFTTSLPPNARINPQVIKWYNLEDVVKQNQ